LEIGYEENHVHFLIQSVPSLSISEICMKVKSITAKEIFRRFPEVKLKLWGGNFWTSGYYANTVGQYGNKDVIKKYIENQGKEVKYQKVYDGQLTLFDD
jgi:REP element-mobilizing transposase RayT